MVCGSAPEKYKVQQENAEALGRLQMGLAENHGNHHLVDNTVLLKNA